MPRPAGRAGRRRRLVSTSTVDLGESTEFRRVAIDSGGNLGDYARNWQLEASVDGASWTVIGAGAGIGQLTNVDVEPTSARYLRISSTGSAGNWWSIADVRLYG